MNGDMDVSQSRLAVTNPSSSLRTDKVANAAEQNQTGTRSKPKRLKPHGSLHEVPRLILMDLEGTLLRKAIHLDDGKVAPSAWTLLAERLGPDALQEEQRTKDRWNNGFYRNYVHWMEDSIRIHQRHGLTADVFEDVMASVQEMPGAREAVRMFHGWGAITAIVSGGFKALADRVQRSLRIHHALAGCEYFFDPKTGQLQHWNVLPTDYEGKAAFLRMLRREYRLDRQHCVFIGDAQNDVAVAMQVGLSIAFNAQPELQAVCTHSVNQDEGQEDFMAIAALIKPHGTS